MNTTSKSELDAYSEGIDDGWAQWTEQADKREPYLPDTPEAVWYEKGVNDGWGDAYHCWLHQV